MLRQMCIECGFAILDKELAEAVPFCATLRDGTAVRVFMHIGCAKQKLVDDETFISSGPVTPHCNG